MRDPTLAVVLSAIVPEVGQLYNRRILAGILWLIITAGLWIGTGRPARLGMPRSRGRASKDGDFAGKTRALRHQIQRLAILPAQ